MRHSRYTALGLAARRFRAALGPLLAVFLVSVVLATVATAIPLALRAMASDEAHYQVEALPPSRSGLLATSQGGPTLDPTENPFVGFNETIEEIRAAAPDPLLRALGPGSFSAVSIDSYDAINPAIDFQDPIVRIRVAVSDDLQSRIRMLEGEFADIYDPAATTVDQTTGEERPAALDIVLAQAIVDPAAWKVGETRDVILPSGPTEPVPVRLAGVFEAIDANDPYWALDPTALRPGISFTPFTADYTMIVTSTAFVAPESWRALSSRWAITMQTTIGFPFSTTGLTVDEVQELLPQLRGYLSSSHRLTDRPSLGYASVASFETESEQALTGGLQRAGVATVVVTMIMSGPIGLAIAVLWLLSRLLVVRRRAALTLASARGASVGQLRRGAAVESLLLSVPAAAIGALAAWLLFREVWTPALLVAPAVVALVPPVLIVLATNPSSLRESRTDVDPRRRGTARWITEVLVFAATALSLTLLLQRGLTTNADAIGVDPLLAATPLLLALSMGLVVLRVYPLPVLAIQGVAKRGAGIVAFLGSARAIRESAAGLAPVLAMVVGLAVVVFSGVLLGTLQGGTADAAAARIGAELRLDSPPLSETQVDAILELDGIAEGAALFRHQDLKYLDAAGITKNVAVIVADTAALARVQAGLPGSADLSELSELREGAIPLLLSNSLAAAYRGGDVELARLPAVIVGAAGQSTSLSTVVDWVLIDRAFAADVKINTFRPRALLVTLEPDADLDTVRASVLELAGGAGRLTTTVEEVDRMRLSPVVGTLPLLLASFIGIVALLCAATVVLSLLISAPARERLLALLRTLGLSAGQARGITAWETVPASVVAIIAGCALGAVLPFLVLAGVDLRLFTGGSQQPPVTVDPLLLLAVVGGFVVLVTVSTVAAIGVARRVSVVRALRTSEEG